MARQPRYNGVREGDVAVDRHYANGAGIIGRKKSVQSLIFHLAVRTLDAKLVWNSRRFEGEQKVISVIDCKIKQLEIISECVMYGVSVSSPCIVRTNHLESNR